MTHGPIVLVAVDALQQGYWRRAVSSSHVSVLVEVESDDPILLSRDGQRVIDGWHRVLAARSTGRTHVPAVHLTHTGQVAEVSAAVEANSRHGLPLNESERRGAVRALLLSRPCPSARQIEQICGVGRRTVRAVAEELAASTGARPRLTPGPVHGDCDCQARMAALPRRVGRDGRSRPADPSAQQESVAAAISRHPDLSDREIAAHLGVVAVATVAKTRLRLPECNVRHDRSRPSLLTRIWRLLVHLLLGRVGASGDTC